MKKMDALRWSYGVLLSAIMRGLSFRDMEGMPRDLSKDEIRALQSIREAKIAELKRRGQKPFEFDGVTIYALNRKNAERQYKNFIKNN